jgi:hypothetical protein
LREWFELSDRFDGVTEELHTEWIIPSTWEHIKNTTSNRDLSRLAYKVRPLKPSQRKVRDQFVVVTISRSFKPEL